MNTKNTKLKPIVEHFKLEEKPNTNLTNKTYFKLKKEHNKKEKENNSKIETSFLVEAGQNNLEKYVKEIKENSWTITPELNNFPEENLTKLYQEDDFVDDFPYATINRFGIRQICLSLSPELLVFLNKLNLDIKNAQTKPEYTKNLLMITFDKKTVQKGENLGVNQLRVKEKTMKVLEKMNINLKQPYSVSFNYNHNVLIINFNNPIKEMK